jgi:hypothetical protein
LAGFINGPGNRCPGLPSIRVGFKSEHQILHTPGGDSETAGEEYPIYNNGKLKELTRGEYGHLQPTSFHIFSSPSTHVLISSRLFSMRLPFVLL